MTDAKTIKKSVDLAKFLADRYHIIVRNRKGKCLYAHLHKNGDANPSLLLSEGGKAAKCLAGDHLKGWADCFKIVQHMEHVDFPTAIRICGEYVGVRATDSRQPPRRIIRRYAWRDREGQTAWHLRWEPGVPKFTWAQDTDGKQFGLGNCRPDLYHREAVVKASHVILCEGERDAETVNGWLHELGLSPETVATTTPNGAGDAKPDYLAPLEGKSSVFLSGDNDDAGQGYVRKLGQLLQEKVQTLNLLEVPEGYNDWAAWQEADGRAEKFRSLLDSSVPYRESGRTEESLDREAPQILAWEEFLKRPKDPRPWRVTGLARPGWLVALAGHGKHGKTTLGLHLLASLSAGLPFLEHCVPEACPTLYLGFEMHPSDLADLLRPISCGKTFTCEPRIVLDLPPPLRLAHLESLLKQELVPGVLVIDSYRAAFMPGRDEEKDAGMVGRILRGLQRIARKTDWTIVLIHHFKKSGTGEFLDASGSGEWVAAPDAVWTWSRPKWSDPGVLRVTGRMPPVDDLSVRLSPAECVALGTVQQVSQEATYADFLRHLPEPDEDPLTVEDIRSRWGPDSPSETTLYDKLKQYSEETPPKVERSGKGQKASPFRFRKANMVPSVRNAYTDGRKTHSPDLVVVPSDREEREF